MSRHSLRPPRDKAQMRAAMHALRPPRSAGENHNYTVTAAGLVCLCLVVVLKVIGAPWWTVSPGATAMTAMTICGVICQRRFKTWRCEPPSSPDAQLEWLLETRWWQSWPLWASPPALLWAAAGALLTSGRPVLAWLLVACIAVVLACAVVYGLRGRAALKAMVEERSAGNGDGRHEGKPVAAV